MTRGSVLLVGLVVFGLGGIGYVGFRLGGFDGFTPGIAASALLMLIILVWTGSYLFRVVSGRMTYMEQRRRYRAAYDAATDAELQARFEALSPEEQRRLLAELGQLESAPESAEASAIEASMGPEAPTP